MVKHLFSKIAINIVFLLLTNFVSSQVTVPIISKTQGELETYMFSDEAITTEDLSSYLLATLFGEAITELVGKGINPVTGILFRYFNLGVLGIISFMIGYTVLTSVLGAAQEGGAFSTRVSPWQLFRIVGGTGLILPTPTGYSALQIIVFKVVIMGVGFANTVWQVALQEIEMNPAALQIFPDESLSNSDASTTTAGERQQDYAENVHDQLNILITHVYHNVATRFLTANYDLLAAPLSSSMTLLTLKHRIRE